MARAAERTVHRATDHGEWWSSSTEEIADQLGVDPSVGLSSEGAAKVPERDGLNALAVELAVPGWRRLARQYRSYMQIILLGAAAVSLAIQEWSTAVFLLLVITVVNAVVGLRQEGKAESAMNALEAVVKTTAGVRRDGSEAQIAGEELGVNDAQSIKAASPGLRSPYAGRSANRFPDLDRQQCLPQYRVV
jgi:Ca2+-transporting ATPase